MTLARLAVYVAAMTKDQKASDRTSIPEDTAFKSLIAREIMKVKDPQMKYVWEGDNLRSPYVAGLNSI